MICARHKWLGVGFRWFRYAALALLVIAVLVGRPSSNDAAAAPPEKDTTTSQKAATEQAKAEALEKDVTQGALRLVKEDGSIVECPLKHTDVKADIAGFVTRVRVTQTFHNPSQEKIEAVYVFPLPHEAAVDEMTMVMGERRIVGLIKRRDEARHIYAQALAAGQTAALLEQERPNIFTQSVGNIEPGQDVTIEISYVDVLRYDVGTYDFQFPMVVGPRYIPGAPISSSPPTPKELQGKVSPPVPDTTRVPDASRITPPVLKPGVRNGHDISLSIKLDAGVPIQKLSVANHQAEIERDGDRRATIKLASADSVPNKDFLVRYDVTGNKPAMAVLTHTGNYADARNLGSGYFLLMIQPKEDERLKKRPPREIVFLVDVSGSMSGEPTAKVIDAMHSMLKLCREQDTVQVVTFASQANKLFDKPVPVNDDNIKSALNFTGQLKGSGGTEMLKGVQMAIDEPIDKERLRIVVMLTDGYIGNEAEIIQHVGKNCGDQIRFWCIGIGSSPNMFLVDGVAKQGGGMGKQLGLKDDTTALTQEVMTRIQRAQLTKIQIDWGGLQVAATYPARIPELWAGRPVILVGRYAGGGDAKITVRGNVEGEAVSWPLDVTLSNENKEHDALAKIWARRKIEDLMQQTFYQGSPAVEEEVTAIALDYKLMSQYTSFVAVDPSDVKQQETPARPPRQMLVPVPLPEGTRWEGFFGSDGDQLLDELEGAQPFSRLRRLEETKELSLGRRHLFFEQAERVAKRESSVRLGATLAPSPQRLAARYAGGGLAGGDRYSRGLRLAMPAQGLPAIGMQRRAVLRLESGWAAGGAWYSAQGKSVSGNFGLHLGDNQRLTPADPESASRDYTAESLVSAAEPLLKAAAEALQAAKQAGKKGNVANARAAFEQAYFLDNVASSFGRGDGQVAAESLAALTEIRDARLKDFLKQVPPLNKRLDLVLRDKSLTQALDAVSKAGGVNVRLMPGSLEDAAGLVSKDGTRVPFLDLRGATVAQALDWILLPMRLTWQPAGKEILAASQRRLEGTSAWVYDVSVLALPDAAGLTTLNDDVKAVSAAQLAADEFLNVVRQQLKSPDDRSITWYAPGQLLVVADRATHAAAGELFNALADPQPKLTGEAAQLHQTTSKRAAERKEKVAKRDAEAHRWSVAAMHELFGWQLLAAAAKGQLDLEALTQLQIAWKDPATAELLQSDEALIPLRSLWILTEAAAASSDKSELTALVNSARAQSQSAAAGAIAALEKSPDDTAVFGRALFASLARRGDSGFMAKALPLLTKQRKADSPLAPSVVLAKTMLIPPNDADKSALMSLVQSGIEGNDLVVLAAMACQRAGGEAWSTFRAESADLLGQQPLSGHVIVLVSRLSGSPARRG